MELEFVARALLLGVLLGAGTASAAEIVAPAEPLDNNESTSRQSAGKGGPGGQKPRRVGKTGLEIKGDEGAADMEKLPEKSSASANTGKGETGETTPESAPPTEAPRVVLKGVRG